MTWWQDTLRGYSEVQLQEMEEDFLKELGHRKPGRVTDAILEILAFTRSLLAERCPEPLEHTVDTTALDNFLSDFL